ACACPARIARQTGNSAGNCTRKSPERSFGRHDGALFNSLLESCIQHDLGEHSEDKLVIKGFPFRHVFADSV
ncbi:hypothetical protein, partial [Paraburkholderia sp. BR10954]